MRASGRLSPAIGIPNAENAIVIPFRGAAGPALEPGGGGFPTALKRVMHILFFF